MKTTRRIAVLGLVLLCLAGLSYTVARWKLGPVQSDATEGITFEVVPGMTIASTAHQLNQQGLIGNQILFYWYARLTGQASKIRRGEYELKKSMSAQEVLDVLKSGKSIARALTVAEGLNLFEIAQIFEQHKVGTKEEFWHWVRNPEWIRSLLGNETHDSLEGYLFPETYMVTKFMSTKDVLTQMVQRSLKTFEEVQQSIASSTATDKNKDSIALRISKMNRHQLITLASIVEKETGAPEERPLIASIFYNRMEKGMQLQTDPTVLYGKWLQQKQMDQIPKISRNDLHAPTPYNTYVIPGLPPGPIANPGRDSMKAVLQPARSEYFFFVSRNDGTHWFSKDYETHRKNVQNYLHDQKENPEKSWRDLKKKQGSSSHE